MYNVGPWSSLSCDYYVGIADMAGKERQKVIRNAEGGGVFGGRL